MGLKEAMRPVDQRPEEEGDKIRETGVGLGRVGEMSKQFGFYFKCDERHWRILSRRILHISKYGLHFKR